MENATKALIIAAAILIAIVLISLGVFVLGNGTELVKQNSDMTETEVAAFNSKFEAYFGNKVSGTKVKQLVNAVKQHNRTADTDKKIYFGTTGTDESYDGISAGNTYTVSAGNYASSGLLTHISISPTTP